MSNMERVAFSSLLSLASQLPNPHFLFSVRSWKVKGRSLAGESELAFSLLSSRVRSPFFVPPTPCITFVSRITQYPCLNLISLKSSFPSARVHALSTFTFSFILLIPDVESVRGCSRLQPLHRCLRRVSLLKVSDHSVARLTVNVRIIETPLFLCPRRRLLASETRTSSSSPALPRFRKFFKKFFLHISEVLMEEMNQIHWEETPLSCKELVTPATSERSLPTSRSSSRRRPQKRRTSPSRSSPSSADLPLSALRGTCLRPARYCFPFHKRWVRFEQVSTRTDLNISFSERWSTSRRAV